MNNHNRKLKMYAFTENALTEYMEKFDSLDHGVEQSIGVKNDGERA